MVSQVAPAGTVEVPVADGPWEDVVVRVSPGDVVRPHRSFAGRHITLRDREVLRHVPVSGVYSLFVSVTEGGDVAICYRLTGIFVGGRFVEISAHGLAGWLAQNSIDGLECSK